MQSRTMAIFSTTATKPVMGLRTGLSAESAKRLGKAGAIFVISSQVATESSMLLVPQAISSTIAIKLVTGLGIGRLMQSARRLGKAGAIFDTSSQAVTESFT